MPSTASRALAQAARIFVVPAALVALGAVLASAQTAPPRTGAAIYASACLQCHGVDGRGGSQERLGLPVPPPDFTDCQFAPREPDADWASVIHGGGPGRAFDRTMPAFGDALTDDDIALVLGHVRTFCGERTWPRGELNLPKAMATEKAFPEDEVIVTTTIAAEGDGEVKTKAVYEKRFGARNQIELVVPVASHATNGSWSSGLGDLAFAFKRVLAHSHARGSIVSLTGEVVFPTASKTDGFGKGYAVFEPFLTFGQALPADTFFQFQGGFALPNNDAAHNESFFRFVVGKTVTQGRGGRAWSPMVEFLGAKAHADGTKVQWDILPQMQISLSKRQHVLMNVGVRLPMTDSGPRRTQLMVYLLWDWFDGGFFQGW